MEEVQRRTSLAPLASPCFVLCLIGAETEGLLDYQERAGDHFHCTVEPSPGHIFGVEKRHKKHKSLGLMTCPVTVQSPDREARGQRFIWGAANGGLRDGGLSKSEEICGKRPFSPVFWIFQVLSGLSGKGEKVFPEREGRHPLKPPFVTPPFAALQFMCYPRNPRNINIFARVPDWEDR